MFLFPLFISLLCKKFEPCINSTKYTLFFISNTFISKARLKLGGKNQVMLRNTLRLNFCCFNIIHILHPRNHSKIIGHIPKNKQRNKCVCVDEIVRLIVMKMKVKRRSYKCDINRPRSWHGHKYSKNKKCLSMMMFICIKQHLSNIWN